MKTKLCHWTVMATMLLAGCLPSLNPVYTDSDLVFDPALVGVWKQPKSSATWAFSKRDDKSYDLAYTDEKGRTGRFIARMAKLDGTLFLDLYPAEFQADESALYKFHLVPIHTVYLVRRTTPRVDLAAIDYDWLEKLLAEHPDAIAHATFDGRKLITASTTELQAFVLQHKEAFRGDFSLERQLENKN